MNSVFGKVVIGLIVVLIASYFYSENKQEKIEQEKLQEEISDLKKLVVEQKEIIVSTQQETIEDSELQREVIEQAIEGQAEAAKKQSQIMQQQIDTMEVVVDDLEKERQLKEELRKAQEISQANLIEVTYLSGGFQTAAALKGLIVQYYMTHDRFPNSNSALDIPSPTRYATTAIRSITVSQGGKITIVYNEKTGRDKGAITIKPRYIDMQFSWKCTTRDYDWIQKHIPSCEYVES